MRVIASALRARSAFLRRLYGDDDILVLPCGGAVTQQRSEMRDSKGGGAFLFSVPRFGTMERGDFVAREVRCLGRCALCCGRGEFGESRIAYTIASDA